MKSKHYLSVILGASLWGTASLFVHGLYAIDLKALEITTLRAISASLILLAYSAVMERDKLIIDWKDIPWFIGTGCFSIVFFSWCYFFTMKETSVSMAVILLYTAPAMVTVMSRIFFKEPFTGPKITALVMALTGLVTVTGIFGAGGMSISTLGLMTGLGSGLGYALYSILGRVILRKYDPMTMTNYTFIVASIALTPVIARMENPAMLLEPPILIRIFGLGLVPTALAYILYTRGLKHLEASKASILATIEPAVGTLIGVLVFGDLISLSQWGGIGLILASLVVVNRPAAKRA